MYCVNTCITLKLLICYIKVLGNQGKGHKPPVFWFNGEPRPCLSLSFSFCLGGCVTFRCGLFCHWRRNHVQLRLLRASREPIAACGWFVVMYYIGKQAFTLTFHPRTIQCCLCYCRLHYSIRQLSTSTAQDNCI